MRQKPETGTVLLLDGQLVCPKCLDQGDTIERRLREGDTYSEEPCDRCVERPPHVYKKATT